MYIHRIHLYRIFCSSSSAKLMNSHFQGMKDSDAIWRRIVERNLINPKDKKKKKTPTGVGQYFDLTEDEDEGAETSGTEDASQRESEEWNICLWPFYILYRSSFISRTRMGTHIVEYALTIRCLFISPYVLQMI